MVPTIGPGDVVLIDQHLARRRHPAEGGVWVVNLDVLEGEAQGGAIKRIEMADGVLTLSSDNPDKTRYPTRDPTGAPPDPT